MINRKIAPKISLTESIKIPQPQFINFPNSTKLLVINEGDVDVCRLDLIFNAGSRYQNSKLEATATLSLMPEGTVKHSSQQISEHFDFFGSFISIGADRDFAKVTVYSLNKYLSQTLEMLEEIVKEPTFPQEELEIWSKKGKYNLTVELDKTSTLSRMEFFRRLFGSEHAYGTFAMPNDYDSIKRESLANFHSQRISSSDAIIVLAGKTDDNHIKLIEKHIGNTNWGNQNVSTSDVLPKALNSTGKYFVHKPNALQSAIRVGREMFPRTHPDFTDMVVINTILGGYFGSRLMKNIREDKGYTYGIGSTLAPLRDSGFFAISTEVGAEFTKQTLNEIKSEVEKLKTEPISSSELQTVKNYMMGDILRSFNGPFSISDNIIGLLNFNNLEYEYFNKQIDSVKNITPERIIELSKMWLDQNLMVECVAGIEDPF